MRSLAQLRQPGPMVSGSILDLELRLRQAQGYDIVRQGEKLLYGTQLCAAGHKGTH
jgi:hypothetical protein